MYTRYLTGKDVETGKQFDLIEALEENGFERGIDRIYEGWTVATYRKRYSKMANLAWYGSTESAFWAEAQIHINPDGKPVAVWAMYETGKVKQHMYDKRAFNAMKQTIENNGYEF